MLAQHQTCSKPLLADLLERDLGFVVGHKILFPHVIFPLRQDGDVPQEDKAAISQEALFPGFKVGGGTFQVRRNLADATSSADGTPLLPSNFINGH